jgi:hypothetical protein
MLNLLKTEFKTLFKWKATWYLLFFSLIFGAISPVFNSVIYEDPTLSGCFEFIYVYIMITSIISGLFIYRDYSQNTIRNKIVVGHSRISVYLSKVIVTCVLFICVVSILTLSNVLIGLCVGDLDYIDWGVYLQNCGMVLCTAVTISSFVGILAINIQSPLGAMLPMMFLMALVFFSLIYTEMLMINEQTEILNVFQTLPVTSTMMLSETVEPYDITGTVVYTLALSFLMNAIGVLIFRKIDLK